VGTAQGRGGRPPLRTGGGSITSPRIHIECGLARTLLHGFASELAAPQRKLRQALEDADGLKFTVQKDGSVNYPISKVPLAPGTGTATPGAPVPFLPGQTGTDADPNQRKAEGIAEDIAAAVREANEIDGRYSSALGKLKAPPGLEVTEGMMADAAHDKGAAQQAAGKFVDKNKIPHGRSPAENKKWWDGLRDPCRR
jgi:hypothetical protein